MDFLTFFDEKAWACFVTPDLQKNEEDEEAKEIKTNQNVNPCLFLQITFLSTQSTQNTRKE